MNWEAIGVIGILALVLGLALFALARFFINRKLRLEGVPSQQPLRLTKTGWAWLSASIAILLVGLVSSP